MKWLVTRTAAQSAKWASRGAGEISPAASRELCVSALIADASSHRRHIDNIEGEISLFERRPLQCRGLKTYKAIIEA